MLTPLTEWNSTWTTRHSRATGQPAYATKDIKPGWFDSRTDEQRRRAPVPVEFDNGPLAVCCCPQAIRPGVARLLSRVVGYSGDAYRAVLTSAGPVACPATRRIFEFSGVCCAPGEPSLVAEASGVNSLKATSGLRHRVCPS